MKSCSRELGRLEWGFGCAIEGALVDALLSRMDEVGRQARPLLWLQEAELKGCQIVCVRGSFSGRYMGH